MTQLGGLSHPTALKRLDLPVERMIAGARVVLVGFSLLAVYLDPFEPLQYNDETAAILLGYFILSLSFGAIALSGRTRKVWQVTSHLADIFIVSMLLYLSRGPLSPFFIFYSFVLIAATLRWSWRETLATTALLFVLMTLLTWQVTIASEKPLLDNVDFELNRTILRLAFLLVSGGLLAAFGLAHERSRARLTKLAAWPSLITNLSQSPAAAPLGGALSHVAEVTQVPRIAVVWQPKDSSHREILLWERDRCDYVETEKFQNFDLVARELAGATFATADVKGKRYLKIGGSAKSADPLIDSALIEWLAPRSVCSAPFEGDLCAGRLFLLDRVSWSPEYLLLAEIVASRVGVELEHWMLRRELEGYVAARERVRLGRDLHDGILQSLASARLQLHAAAQRAGGEAQRSIEAVAQLLRDEQQRIRAFVEDRKDFPFLSAEMMDLRSEAQEVVEQSKRLWNCEASVTVRPDRVVTPRWACRELKFLISESFSNAARSGQATNISFALEQGAKTLRLRVSDNGKGLAGFKGHYDQNALEKMGIGPISIRKRLADLGGSLSISSSESGLLLDMTMPLAGGSR